MIEAKAQDLWRSHCKKEEGIPLFLRPWWLDVTCGVECWGAALACHGSRIDAALPYRIRKSRFFTHLDSPPMTPYLGAWIRPSQRKYAESLSREHSLLGTCLAALPKYASLSFNSFPDIVNGLPFLWHGCEVRTLWTYRVPVAASAENDLWANMEGRARTDVKKALGTYGLIVREGSCEELLFVYTKTWQRQGLPLPLGPEFYHRMYAAVEASQAGTILIAEDKQGQIHAGAMFLWDDACCYYLIGGADPELRKSSAQTLLLWEGIVKARQKGFSHFDFEGSYVPAIEKHFRSFGAVQAPYLQVYHRASPWLECVELSRQWLRNVPRMWKC